MHIFFLFAGVVALVAFAFGQTAARAIAGAGLAIGALFLIGALYMFTHPDGPGKPVWGRWERPAQSAIVVPTTPTPNYKPSCADVSETVNEAEVCQNLDKLQ